MSVQRKRDREEILNNLLPVKPRVSKFKRVRLPLWVFETVMESFNGVMTRVKDDNENPSN